MGLKSSGKILLPRLDKIKDPEVRKVFQQMMKAIQGMNVTNYGDLAGLEERITELEP